MRLTEPWQRAETPGPKKASIIPKPEVAASLLKRAHKPLMIVGSGSIDATVKDKPVVEYAVQISKAGAIPIVATAGAVKTFIEKRLPLTAYMPVMEIAERLRDRSWSGLDGSGPYDVATFIGVPYYMEWLILSGLKHFAKGLITMSLDRFYQPHANWSLPNMSLEELGKTLQTLADTLKEGG